MGSLVIGPTAVRRFPWKLVFELLGTALFITLLLIRTFLVELVVVRGNTMAPNVLDGDYVLVRRERLAGRGDVVLLELGGQVVLRRVVGVPGDRLGTDAGALTLNDLPVPTQLVGPFAYPEPTLRGFRTHRQVLYAEQIEPGRFERILGDHVGAGRPWNLTFEAATVEDDQLFVLCDNRRECPADERQGLVPRSAVVGVARSLVWPGDARAQASGPGQRAEAVPLTAGPLASSPGSEASSSPPFAGAPLK